eukprot:Rmarinus@m.8250
MEGVLLPPGALECIQNSIARAVDGLKCIKCGNIRSEIIQLPCLHVCCCLCYKLMETCSVDGCSVHSGTLSETPLQSVLTEVLFIQKLIAGVKAEKTAGAQILSVSPSPPTAVLISPPPPLPCSPSSSRRDTGSPSPTFQRDPALRVISKTPPPNNDARRRVASTRGLHVFVGGDLAEDKQPLRTFAHSTSSSPTVPPGKMDCNLPAHVRLALDRIEKRLGASASDEASLLPCDAITKVNKSRQRSCSLTVMTAQRVHQNGSRPSSATPFLPNSPGSAVLVKSPSATSSLGAEPPALADTAPCEEPDRLLGAGSEHGLDTARPTKEDCHFVQQSVPKPKQKRLLKSSVSMKDLGSNNWRASRFALNGESDNDGPKSPRGQCMPRTTSGTRLFREGLFSASFSSHRDGIRKPSEESAAKDPLPSPTPPAPTISDAPAAVADSGKRFQAAATTTHAEDTTVSRRSVSPNAPTGTVPDLARRLSGGLTAAFFHAGGREPHRRSSADSQPSLVRRSSSMVKFATLRGELDSSPVVQELGQLVAEAYKKESNVDDDLDGGFQTINTRRRQHELRAEFTPTLNQSDEPPGNAVMCVKYMQGSALEYMLNKNQQRIRVTVYQPEGGGEYAAAFGFRRSVSTGLLDMALHSADDSVLPTVAPSDGSRPKRRRSAATAPALLSPTPSEVQDVHAECGDGDPGAGAGAGAGAG